MPTVPLSLGRYVVMRGKPGQERVYFLVNRDRPQGWPPTIRLPQDAESRARGYGDPAFMAAVLSDAQRLTERLHAARAEQTNPIGPAGSLPVLIDQWQRSEHWRTIIKPRTRQSYATYCRYICAWSAAIGDPHVAHITPSMIRTWRDSGVQGPTTLRNAIRVLRIVLNIARENRLIDRNPVEEMAALKSGGEVKRVHVDLWSPEDVALYVDEAVASGWIGGARLIQGLWDSMGRVTDGILWRPEHYNRATGILAYATSKSNGKRPSMARMSARFAELTAGCNTLYLVTQPDGIRPYAELRDDKKVSSDFAALRERVVAKGGPARVLRHLRHSSLTHAQASGVSPDQARLSSTHTDDRTTLTHYIKANAETANEIARKRGII